MKTVVKQMLLFFALAACAHAAFAQQQAQLIGRWSDPTLVGSAAYNNTYNEVWGLAVNGREFGVIGSTAGTHIIDITDAIPVQVALVPGAATGPVVIHRDYKRYKNYLYAVCDEGNSTLQIIDISNLPNSVTVAYNSSMLFKRAHNIFIDSATAKLYTCSTSFSNGFAALAAYDLTNPISPVHLGSYNSFGGNAIGHVHDAFVRNDTAYLNCGYDGFYVVHFANMTNPTTLGSLTSYPQQGYNHSGYLNRKGDYYYMADENHGADIKALNVSDLSDIEVTSVFNAAATSSFSIPHNQIWHDNKLFVSYYYDGLQVYDLSNPAQPQRSYYYDTYPSPHTNSYHGAWGVYPFLPSGKVLIADMQTGLYVFSLPPAVGTDRLSYSETTATVFPQPVVGRFTLRFDAPASTTVAVKLLDSGGRLVEQLGNYEVATGNNELSLDISPQLPAGLYVIHLVGDKLLPTAIKIMVGNE